MPWRKQGRICTAQRPKADHVLKIPDPVAHLGLETMNGMVRGKWCARRVTAERGVLGHGDIHTLTPKSTACCWHCFPGCLVFAHRLQHRGLSETSPYKIVADLSFRVCRINTTPEFEPSKSRENYSGLVSASLVILTNPFVWQASSSPKLATPAPPPLTKEGPMPRTMAQFGQKSLAMLAARCMHAPN